MNSLRTILSQFLIVYIIKLKDGFMNLQSWQYIRH